MNRESPRQSTFGRFLKKDLRAPYWEGRTRNVNSQGRAVALPLTRENVWWMVTNPRNLSAVHFCRL